MKTTKILVVFIGGLLAACQTSELILVQNSAGFDNTNPATIENRNKKPEWTSTGYQHPENENFYAVGISNNHPFAQMDRWSQQQATEEATADAQRQIAQYIRSNVKSFTSLTTENVSGIKQAENKIVVMEEGREELITNIVVNSGASIRQVKREEFYYEKWQRIGQDGAGREYYTYYMLLSIPKSVIADEWKRIEKIQDLAAELAKNLEDRQKEYDAIRKNLMRVNYQDNESFYNEEYHNLLQIYSLVKNIKFPANALELQKQQEDLLKTIEKDVKLYDPQDKQKQIVREFQDRILALQLEIDKLKNDHGGVVKDKESEIKLRDQKIALLQDELANTLGDVKNEINNLHQRGVTFVSQYTFFAYPSRPSERLVTAGDGVSVYISTNSVNNRDFTSFLTMNNSANASRGESGLENPAINVSWLEAALYCNWLSRLYGMGEYYSINGETVTHNRGNGYRLPSRNEILAGLREGILEPQSLQTLAVWGAGERSDSGYAYRLSGNPREQADIDALLAERVMAKTEYDTEIGFWIVRNE